ncbi:hypothetical protein COT52_03030 [candidate division WWE3 bacterium CG08_land_8_20_14_0_20_43_13]|uniref:Uncharacterized protein n=1 Tax=candidate division WWE3 bacterium CG08_land_8_20_14_0_20_43_13 TaxID=1975087 RepID=A0A2H0X6N2_UNCKA|nr:MAG: hypothetical protein COT52_03030 [candidate division WWE3 bacterium CG08_land_8_20_14_0_20_43_13]
MNVLNNLLRKPGRLLLTFITKATIKKHQHEIVVITGPGETAPAREAVFQVLKEEFPTRRNLETPASEFCLPLAVLGMAYYPNGIGQWLLSLAKTVVSLIKNRPYSHKLVMEVPDHQKDIFDYWMRILKPKVVISCGQDPVKYLWISKVIFQIGYPETPKNDDYLKIAKQVGRYFGMNKDILDKAAFIFTPPKPRISIIKTDHFIVVDNSYFYLPSPFKAVLEVVEKLGSKAVLITDRKGDFKKSKALRLKIILIKKGEMPKDKGQISEKALVIRVQQPLAQKLIEKITNILIV